MGGCTHTKLTFLGHLYSKILCINKEILVGNGWLCHVGSRPTGYAFFNISVTCWWTCKKHQNLEQNILTSRHAFFVFVHVMYLSCYNELKHALKSNKYQNLFSLGFHLVCPTYADSTMKLSSTDFFSKICQEDRYFVACCWHVTTIYN